jgi:hypothetical protein
MRPSLTAIAGTKKIRQKSDFGRQFLPVLVIRGNAYEHTLNARVRAQAFKGMQNDGASEEWEILLGYWGLHPPTLTARRDEGPDSDGGGQECRPTSFVWP